MGLVQASMTNLPTRRLRQPIGGRRAKTPRPRCSPAALALPTLLALVVSGCGNPPIGGEWIVDQARQMTIPAMNPAEARMWIGRRAVFAPDHAAFGPLRCDSPDYRARVIPADSFFRQLHVQPDSLGLSRKTTLDVVLIECNGQPWPALENVLVRADSVHLLTFRDGVFFRLERRAP